MTKPLISVVMPTHNTPHAYLRQAVESILTQTLADFELIIIDDGSTEGDADVVSAYGDRRIRLLQNETQRRLPYSLNRGIEAARGRYIARMDADDIALPRRFERQVAFLETRPEIGILAARAQNFGDVGGLFASMAASPEELRAQLFFGSSINHPSVMMRKSFLDTHGLRYNEAFHCAEDYELFARAAFAGELAELPCVLMRYRRHKRQLSETEREAQIQTANRVRAWLLARIGITVDEAQMQAHYALCTGQPQPEAALAAISDWVELLLAQNARYCAFAPPLFERMIMAGYLVLCVKHFRAGRESLADILRLCASRRMLRPRLYPQYLRRLRYTCAVHWGASRPR